MTITINDRIAILKATERDLLRDGLVTIAKGAELKGVSYDSMRMWIKNHPELDRWKWGNRVIIRLADLEKYNPLKG